MLYDGVEPHCEGCISIWLRVVVIAAINDTVLTMINDLGPLLNGLTITFCILNVLSVTLRAWVRARLVQKFGADDFLLVIACVRSNKINLPDRLY